MLELKEKATTTQLDHRKFKTEAYIYIYIMDLVITVVFVGSGYSTGDGVSPRMLIRGQRPERTSPFPFRQKHKVGSFLDFSLRALRSLRQFC